MARQANHQRTAVDRAAEEYWAAYFKEYGKQWTRKIPRRVAQALAESIHKAASRGKHKASLRVVRAAVAPLAWAESATGGLTFEGVFRGTVVREGRQSRELKAFRAEFDAHGKLTNLKALAA
jgi:hypothetical protein